jgi:hypothetical protein
VTLTAASGAWAQTPPPADRVAQARQHFNRGVKLYEEDDFRAALIEFGRAYEIAPNWAVLYNVGQSYYQLRDYAGALGTLERYLREGGDRIAKERHAQVEREVEELRGRVARVAVVCSVSDADVTLDDAPVDRAALRAPLLIGAGRHTLAARRRGYASATRMFDIAGGDSIEVRLDLAQDARDAAAPREPPSYGAAIAVTGIGAAGVATGVVFGLLALSDRSSLRSECSTARTCPASAQGDVDAFSRDGALSTIGFGIGAVGIVVGSYLFFRTRGEERRPGTATTIAPWIGYGSGGLGGSF